jgi:carbon-monoxide dehydrogenase large subunit
MVFRSMIGATVKRKEDPNLITGKSMYVGDIKMPGMRYVAFVRSPFAHANITSIDTSAALERDGVLDVITGRDFADKYDLLPIGGEDEDKPQRSHYALSVDRVRHVGEAVAVVIAESPEAALDAVEDVSVEWEQLPVVADLLTAYEADSPVIFDGMTSNVADVWQRAQGDVDATFANAPHTVSQRMVSQRLAGVPMENRAVLAAPDPVTRGVTIWSSTQAPHGLRSQVKDVLRLPENMIRVIAPDVGGGFGVKSPLYPEEALLPALALHFQAPFMWLESRIENMLVTTHGRAQIADVDVAFDDDGTLLGLRMHVLSELGAYPPFFLLAELTGLMATGNYHIPVVDFVGTSVYTNTIAVAAYRGAGRPEAAYYIERMIELVADELGVDSTEIRRKNYLTPDQFPYTNPTGSIYDTGEYEKNLDTALEFSKYAALREEQARRRAEKGDKLLGIGLATYVEMCGFGPYESAVVRVEPGGTVTVYTGTSPHGQGGETTLAQIVADEIGADFDQIIVRHGDTGAAPMGVGTFGSRGLAVGGSAVMRASVEVRDKAAKIAAHMLEAAPADVELSNGRYQVRGVPDRALTLAEIADEAYDEDLPDDIDNGLESTDFFRPPDYIYPFGTHVVVVEIERETGIVTLRDYFSVDDCGPRISPMLVAGQIHGGIAQGVGQALLEEIVFDEQGQLITGSLMDYAIPHADLFPQFELSQTVTPTTLNPLGAKGIGEAATIGSTPAVVNAVIDALEPFGVRHIDMPLTPPKIWKAMNSG